MALNYNPQPVGLGRLQLGAVLRDAREPVLTPQGVVFEAGAAPTLIAQGVDVQPGEGAFFAGVGIEFNRTAGRRRGFYRVDGVGVGSYGLQFGTIADGFAVTAGVEATAAETAAAVALSLGISADFAGIGGVAEVDAEDDTLIRFSVDATYLDRIWTGGDAGLDDAQSAVVEATFARWRVWGLAKGRTGAQEDRRWILLGDDRTGRALSLEAFGVAGIDRVFVEVVDLDGFVVPIVAPAPREERAALLRDAAAEAFDLVAIAEVAFSDTFKGSTAAGEVVAQGRVDVGASSTIVLGARAGRRGFLIRNEGASTVTLTWIAAGVTLATSSGFSLAAGEIRAQSGDDCPKGALAGLSGGSEAVYFEEW